LCPWFQALEQDKSEEMVLQMNVFKEHLEIDFEEYTHRYEHFRNELEYPFPINQYLRN
jgi:hypothetical protein